MADLSFKNTDKDNFQAGLRWRDLGNRVWTFLNGFFPQNRLRFREEFAGRPGQALPTWLTTQDTSPAGSPTLDFVASGDGGQYAFKLAATNEAEAVGLNGGDNLIIPWSKRPILRFRFKIEPDVTGGSGNFDANTILVLGLASTRNATLDNIANLAWIRMEGANKNIYLETDDGTTDRDDQDTGIDWVANTFLIVEIDAQNLANVRVRINGADVTPSSVVFNMSAATGNAQFLAEVQKNSANMDHRITLDYVEIECDR